MKEENQLNFKKLEKKRQWGTEKSFEPLPFLHAKPSTAQLSLSRISIVLTIFFWVLYIFSIVIRQLYDIPQSYYFTVQAYSYSFVVTILTFSSLVYLITRHGALYNFSKHERVSRSKIDDYFAKKRPSITVLVPSYAEEYQVIRKTLLSAALQEYPNMKIVLLVDDKPNPVGEEEIKRLNKTLNIGEDIKDFLSEPFMRFNSFSKEISKSISKSSKISVSDTNRLAENFKWAANWLNTKASEEVISDHVDVFFANEVFRKLATDFNLISEALKMSVLEKDLISSERAKQLINRLIWTFQADVSVFQRKKYISLSHEANKAMNLNSYIGLMGGTYSKIKTNDGIILIPSKRKSSQDLEIADSEFLLTLDADSILLREYCLRLVYFLEQPENSRVAVTQTPYSSFRGAFTRIERLAGATTDIQHILHQGLSYYNAAFWVGANAVIRKKALNDIVETEMVNGFEVKRYIQDRTVIEDTESSIDLTMHGWKLYNYPERLSYSATPPDFGSLVVQRRRWANGGLLMLQKLWSQLSPGHGGQKPMSRLEFLLRLNYIASIAWSTFGLIFLLAYPYDGRLLSPLVLMAALPYFIATARDLHYSGYRYTDVIRIYGFNLIMLPVNLAGVIKSVEQAVTGKKIPFARTPKIKDRTAADPLFIISPYLIVAFSLFTVWRNLVIENYGNALFAGFNAVVASYAIIAYIGIGNSIADVWFGFINWLFVDDKKTTKQSEKSNEDKLNWKSVIYNG